MQHFAFVYGDVGNGVEVVTRLHRADVIGDVLCGGKAINAVLERFRREGRGILIYLRDGTAGVPLTGIQGEESGAEAARQRQWREVGLGAQILRDLGVRSIRNLSSTPRAYVGLSGFGIEIAATEPVA